VRHVSLALSLATLLLLMGQAHAETVIFLRPSNPSPEVTQALTLLRGELLSVGLEVAIADGSAARPGGDAAPATWLEAFAAQGASAVVNPIGDDRLEAIDVWMLKAQPRRFEVAHVAVDPTAPKQPETLVLRTVEALRAGLLQMDWAARKRRVEPVEEPAKAVAPVVEVRPEPRKRVSVELGAVGMMSLNDLGPALLPTVRLVWAVRPWLAVQASAAGLGSRPTVTTEAGSARVAQQYALLGASFRFRPAQRVWPFVGFSAGVLHTTVEGRSGLGTTGHTLGRWSALFDLSLGAGLRLSSRFYMTLAAHAELAEPYPAVRIVDGVGATSGRPNLLVPLTLGAWL
jgi:hypothetical protein